MTFVFVGLSISPVCFGKEGLPLLGESVVVEEEVRESLVETRRESVVEEETRKIVVEETVEMLPEEQQHEHEKGADTAPIQKIHDEGSATKETSDAASMMHSLQQRLGSKSPEEVVRTAQTESAYCDLITLQEKEGEETTLTPTSPSPSSPSCPRPPPSSPATFPSSPKTPQQTNTANSIITTTAADDDHSELKSLRFHHEMSILSVRVSEMTHPVSDAAAALEATATETAGLTEEEKEKEKASGGTITARESRRVESWMRKSGLGGTCDVGEGFGAVWEGDGVDVEDDVNVEIEDKNEYEEGNSEEETVEMTLARRLQGRGARSETGSESVDSEFQRALRAYMGKGGEYGRGQGRRGGSAPGENGESEFQVEVREMLGLEKVGGGKRKARSV